MNLDERKGRTRAIYAVSSLHTVTPSGSDVMNKSRTYRSSLWGRNEYTAIKTTLGIATGRRRGLIYKPNAARGNDPSIARGSAEVKYQRGGETPHSLLLLKKTLKMNTSSSGYVIRFQKRVSTAVDRRAPEKPDNAPTAKRCFSVRG